ncbi:DUF262 domain-containing protein [Paraburkholderia sp. UCT31]|uniref:DUF262 domain-containing protein n=1 Tax=Paraburkholderia sp. UCT31 TaxID=2615209 RepID=UPI0016550582|nr:DUF262 domain-containing protein [Paraburkholderia sp. UCT31]
MRIDLIRKDANENSDVRMPRPDVQATLRQTNIEDLFNRLSHFEEDRALYPWADRFVMGLPLPSWQRAFKWTHTQQVRFIESIWLGMDLATHMVNDFEMSDGKSFDKFSNIVLDGQQRLRTIERYILNEFAVPDEQGKLRLWSDLGVRERRRFARTSFPRNETRIWDEATLCEIYNRRNYGGTAHLEDERAVPAG